MPEKIVHAPYNFVPFSGKKPCIRYEDISQLPRHDEIREDLKTGEIHITLRAETPVFISDGEKDPHFFRGPDGRFMIPGSTLRGLIRENMQILGFGVMRPGEDMEDYSIFYREFSSARGSTGGALKEVYQDALGITSRRDREGKSSSIPGRVSSGYLFCEDGKYFILPTQGSYLRISRGDKVVQAFREKYAKVLDVAYSTVGDRVSRIVSAKEAAQGMTVGKLLYTGKSVGKVPNHIYLFPPVDREGKREAISDMDVLSYRMDLEARKNSLKAYYDPGFWALPEEGKSKPVFYAFVEGHLFFGMSLYLRIGYPYSLAEGLPEAHRQLNEEKEIPLDYPHAILGFASDKTGGSSYRSRVSVEDCPLVNDTTECPPVQAVLGGPKPSFYPGYVEEGKHYAQEGFRLRGYKQYWLHDVVTSPDQKVNENVGTKLRPLPEGSEFRGVIRFKNLTEDELGLLLWALRLEEGSFQTLGMGKPLGYGRMKLTVDLLREADWRGLYGSFAAATPMADRTDRIEEYISAFDAYICRLLDVKGSGHGQPSIRSLEEIQDFFFLKSSIRSGPEITYMSLKEYASTDAPMPSVRELRSKEEPSEASSEALDALMRSINSKKL